MIAASVFPFSIPKSAKFLWNPKKVRLRWCDYKLLCFVRRLRFCFLEGLG